MSCLPVRTDQTRLSLWESQVGSLRELDSPQAKTEGASSYMYRIRLPHDTDLLASCSFRHGLRRATFLKEEGYLLLAKIMAASCRYIPFF
mgnify:FL=1